MNGCTVVRLYGCTVIRLYGYSVVRLYGPQNLKTSKPQNRKTAKPQNLTTAKPQNLTTAKPQNLTTSILCIFLFALMLTGCKTLKETYKPIDSAPADLYGNIVTNGSEAQPSIATLSWREFFTDANLQTLIQRALENNTDMHEADLRIQEAELTLASTKMEILPTVMFSPQVGYSHFDDINLKTYNVPINVSWQPSLFSRIKNKKLQAEALRCQAEDARAALQSQLIAEIAKAYYQLIVLDRELEIMKNTQQLWNKSLETQRAMVQYGMSYSPAVDQMEASLLGVKAQVVDVELQIRQIENAICLLLSQSPQPIVRSAWKGSEVIRLYGCTVIRLYGCTDFKTASSSLATLSQSAATERNLKTAKPQNRKTSSTHISIGIPMEMITRRADVRAAERVIEAAFYGTQQAKAAFYPSLTLSGSLGWTNNGLVAIDPGKILINALASLTQPIFMQGKLKTQLKLSELQQEQAKNAYMKTLLQAGNEVNQALTLYQKSAEKDAICRQQVSALERAYYGTHELMHHGKATYLEVLTSQETLLEAQLSEAVNLYNQSQAVIALYLALGGGGE